MSMTPVEPPKPPPESRAMFVFRVFTIATLIVVGLFIVTIAAVLVVAPADSY
jgi:hypothetical protein